MGYQKVTNVFHRKKKGFQDVYIALFNEDNLYLFHIHAVAFVFDL
jgi:hypothetical protein